MTVTGVDDEGTEDTDSGDHTIAATDFAPVIDIEKTGPAKIDEGGEDVTWHFEITHNCGSTDPMTVTSLSDDRLAIAGGGGSFNGGPIVLASGASFRSLQPDRRSGSQRGGGGGSGLIRRGEATSTR